MVVNNTVQNSTRDGITLGGAWIKAAGNTVTNEQHIITDVVFDRDSEAPSVRGRSVVFSLAAIRDFIALDAMPDLVRLFTDAEYEVNVGDYR